ncbi:hypothetical protein DSECCO2_272000 [anaerobic digester metagenome]
MSILEKLELKDLVFFRLEFKYSKKEMEQAPLLSMATHYNFYAKNIKFPEDYCKIRLPDSFKTFKRRTYFNISSDYRNE